MPMKQYTTKVFAEYENADQKDAAIAQVKATLLGYDAAIVLTDETFGGKKIATSFTVNEVVWQSGYCQAIMGIILGLKHALMISTSVDVA